MISQPNESTEFPRIGIILPACDEEPCIAAVLHELLAAIDSRKYVVAVGVNGSRDRTALIAKQFPVVVAETSARGYGHGCLAAIAALRAEHPAIGAYIFFAADGASDPRDVHLLSDAYERGHELVLGCRTAMRSNWRAMTLPHVAANFALGLWCTLLTGRWFTDLAPLRLIERRLFEAMSLRELTFGWTIEAQVAAAKLGARIAQLHAHERCRLAGSQKVSGVSWRRTFAIGCCIVAAGWRTHLRFLQPVKALPPIPAARSIQSAAQAIALAATVAMVTACAGKPPLPKYASVEVAARASSNENFAALVPDADVVYFPVESASHGGRSDPAALLLDALRQTGVPITIGWDLVDASQQALLDELQAQQGNAREESIGRLDLGGTGRAREFCRSVLRSSETAGVRHLALAAPPAVTHKVGLGESLAPDEQTQLPRGFRAPAGDYEAFAERLASVRHAAGDVAALYRAHLFAEQFAADQIARHFQVASGGKLLAFLSRSDLDPGRGIPFFVTQKVQVRQLVLGSDRAARRGKLLTNLRGSGSSDVEVVDGTPRAAGE